MASTVSARILGEHDLRQIRKALVTFGDRLKDRKKDPKDRRRKYGGNDTVAWADKFCEAVGQPCRDERGRRIVSPTTLENADLPVGIVGVLVDVWERCETCDGKLERLINAAIAAIDALPGATDRTWPQRNELFRHWGSVDGFRPAEIVNKWNRLTPIERTKCVPDDSGRIPAAKGKERKDAINLVAHALKYIPKTTPK